MPFPSGTPVVTLTGTVPNAVGGTGFTGRIILTPSAVLTDTAHKAVYPGGGPVTFDANGAFSVQVIPNDAAGILPTGWKWQVDLQPAGGQRTTFWTDIPTAAGPTVDLSTLLPTSAPDGTGQSLPPTGPAGGALTGSYPNPQLSAATIAGFDAAGSASAAQSAAQAYADSSKLAKSANLSDLGSVNTARTNLGLGGAAVLNVGTVAGTVAAGNDSRITGALQSGTTAGGDLSGTLPNPTVAKVNGVTVTGTPSTGQVPTATSGTAASWQALPSASTSAAGIVQLDGTAGDIAALGTQAAGATGKAADAGHVHAMPRLDQAQAPTSPVGMNGQKLTNLANGTTATDAATLGQVVPASGGSITGDLDVAGKLTTAGGVALPLMVPSSPRPAYRAASWSQIFQSGHGWTASGSGVASSNVNDTVTYSRGTQSFQVVTTGTGAVANIRKLSGTVPDLTGKAIRLVFRVSDVTHLNQINFQVGTSSVANSFSWRVHTHASTAENQVLSGEWATVVLSWADVRSATGTYSISSTGVPSATSGFTDLLFQVVDDNTGNAVTVNLQAVEIINDTTETFPNGVVSITFDDSYASQYTTARPKMDSYGYRGTLYTIVENIGAGGYLTLPQLQTVQAASAWEVAGHAYYSANHNTKYAFLPAATVEDDIRRCRAWLTANGFPSANFAFPGGYFSQTTDGASIEGLACKYFSGGRGISSADTLEPFPPPMPYRMRAISGIGALAGGAARGFPANLTGAGGSLDRCQLEGQWVILTFHDIVTGSVTTSNQCSQTDFNSIMDAINSRGIPVLPVGDVLRYYS